RETPSPMPPARSSDTISYGPTLVPAASVDIGCYMLPAAMSPAGRTTLLLFVFFQALYALTSSGNAFRIPDEFEVYFQTEHLVDDGDLSIPQTLAIRQPKIVNGSVVGTEPIFYGKFG